MKTQINYSVSQNGNNFNGMFFRRSKLSTQNVIKHAIQHAAKNGFSCAQISITATGSAEPMISRVVLA